MYSDKLGENYANFSETVTVDTYCPLVGSTAEEVINLGAKRKKGREWVSTVGRDRFGPLTFLSHARVREET